MTWKEYAAFLYLRRSGDTETAIVTCPAQNSLAAKRVIETKIVRQPREGLTSLWLKGEPHMKKWYAIAAVVLAAVAAKAATVVAAVSGSGRCPFCHH